MSTVSDIRFLEGHLGWLKTRLTQVVDNPFMLKNISSNIESTLIKINELSQLGPEANISLGFFGRAVLGLTGIQAAFSGNILSAFQKLTKTDYIHQSTASTQTHSNFSPTAELFVTAVQHGSFGFQLGRPDIDNSFEEARLAETLNHIIVLIESVAESEAGYLELLQTIAFETLLALKEFLSVLALAESGVKLESGAKVYELGIDKAKIAYQRTLDTLISEPQTIQADGIFRYLPSKNTFELVADNQAITGKISQTIPLERLEECEGKECSATLVKTGITYKTLKYKDRYELVRVVGK